MLGLIVPMMTSHLGKAIFSPALHAGRSALPFAPRLPLPSAGRRACLLMTAASPPPSPPLPPLPDGILVVHKPTNWTSSDVVYKVRGTLERHLKREGHIFKRRSRLKVGHGGTLDPLATGLLVIGVGHGCRRLQGYLKGAKAYVARAQLGAETDTQDSEGSVIRNAAFDHVALSDLEAAASRLTGQIMQRPPIYSALRKDGKRLHELARAGQITPEEVPERPVTVYQLTVGAFDAAQGTFDLVVKCSGGTYVRSLIMEIGRDVSSAAHMSALERTRHGPFLARSISDAHTAASDASLCPCIRACMCRPAYVASMHMCMCMHAGPGPSTPPSDDHTASDQPNPHHNDDPTPNRSSGLTLTLTLTLTTTPPLTAALA